MDSYTDTSDEMSSMGRLHSNSRDPTPERDPSTKMIRGFLWLLVLFTATSYLSQRIIFQSLEDFFNDVKNMEDICDRSSHNFNDRNCECIFNYLEGLDHPQFQYYFHKMQLLPLGTSKKAWHPNGNFDPESPYIDPKAYVVGCGNSSPNRRAANKDVCEHLEKLLTTDLYTKWWYDTDASCYNSTFNTIKRVHPGLVVALVLILIGIVLTPIYLLQTFDNSFESLNAISEKDGRSCNLDQLKNLDN